MLKEATPARSHIAFGASRTDIAAERMGAALRRSLDRDGHCRHDCLRRLVQHAALFGQPQLVRIGDNGRLTDWIALDQQQVRRPGASCVDAAGACGCVVKMPNWTLLNRDWDDKDAPREESCV